MEALAGFLVLIRLISLLKGARGAPFLTLLSLFTPAILPPPPALTLPFSDTVILVRLY